MFYTRKWSHVVLLAVGHGGQAHVSRLKAVAGLKLRPHVWRGGRGRGSRRRPRDVLGRGKWPCRRSADTAIVAQTPFRQRAAEKNEGICPLLTPSLITLPSHSTAFMMGWWSISQRNSS